MENSTHNSLSHDLHRFLLRDNTVAKMIQFHGWELSPSERWLSVVEAHDVVSQESNLHTATQLLNQNISMHAIPDLNENNNLESTLCLETAICNKHKYISANSFRLSQRLLEKCKIPKKSTTFPHQRHRGHFNRHRWAMKSSSYAVETSCLFSFSLSEFKDSSTSHP